MHQTLLSVADDGEARQRIIEQFSVAFRNTEWNVFDKLGSLLTQGHLVKINLRVRHDEEVEVLAEHEREAEDLLGLAEVHFDFLSLLLLKKQ